MKNVKKFFSTLSLHNNPNGNEAVTYELDDSCGEMISDFETRNPIMPFIRSNVEPGENIEIYLIACVGDGKIKGKVGTYSADKVMEIHKQCYEEELEEIKGAVGGFNCKLEIIEMKGFSNSSHHKLMKEIVSKINDSDIVYMDITFGFKTVSVTQFLALTYAYKIRQGVEIGAMSYGSHYGPMEDHLYNLTEFFLFNNTMNNMADVPQSGQFVDLLLDNMIGEDEQ